ncbi:hypothetical protein H0H87_002625, partial [Tephrocybe sp. NHM501043]
GPGDLWYFPPGIPHSLQATGDDPEGAEFLLVFDSSEFNDDDTFLLTAWLAHVPAGVLAKNFQANISAFAHVPAEELYIFPATLPEPDDGVTSPQGIVPKPFLFPFSKVKPHKFSGGTVKIADTSTFKISKTMTVAEVTVEPGAISEGNARVTIFAAQSNARTFDYQAGDI